MPKELSSEGMVIYIIYNYADANLCPHSESGLSKTQPVVSITFLCELMPEFITISNSKKGIDNDQELQGLRKLATMAVLW